MARDFIVIYGPALSGKTVLAWELGRSLAGKTAVLSCDQLLSGSIAVPDEDGEAELEMIRLQLRLLVANYLKSGYNVVLEGPFIYERAGRLLSYESDIDQLLALMRNLTRRSLVVRLLADEATLRHRAQTSGRDRELAEALRVNETFRPRYGERFVSFDTATLTVAEIADELRARLSSLD
jgi:hypothetical protein